MSIASKDDDEEEEEEREKRFMTMLYKTFASDRLHNHHR